MRGKQLDLFSDLPAPGEFGGPAVAPLAPRAELPEHRDRVVNSRANGREASRNARIDDPAPSSEISGGEPTGHSTAGSPKSPGWEAWLARPHTPQTRLEDLVLQIRRDMAVQREDKSYHTDDNFYEERIAGCREEAARLVSRLKLEG